MKEVELPSELLAAIASHARETYPDECCGFLIAAASDSPEGAPRRIQATERAANVFEGERRRRFLIHPSELRAIERRMEEEGRSVVGFYHSHPDHPAAPSQFDQDHAWPWYSYLVLSVTAVRVEAVGAFELDPEDSAFRPVALRTPGDLEGPKPLIRG